MPRANNRQIAILNPLRHGLTARSIAIPGLEEHGDWLNFRDAVLESLVPEGALESELAAVAEYLWRRRRIARAEQQAVGVRGRKESVRAVQAQAALDREDPESAPIPAEVRAVLEDHTLPPERLLPDARALDKILRYEAHINRQLYHAMNQLEALQNRRRGEPAPLARVSVVGLPGT